MQPLIIVGSESRKTLMRKGKTLYQEDFDMIAQHLSSLGLPVARYDEWWPRNRFYSQPNRTLWYPEHFSNDPQTRLANYGQFLSDDSSMIFPSYLYKQRTGLEQTARRLLKKENFIYFDISASPGSWSHSDIDFYLGHIPSLGVLVSYQSLIWENDYALGQLHDVGYHTVITLPDEEYDTFGTNFETFDTPKGEIVVIDKACQLTIRILEAYGIPLVPTPSPIQHITWPRSNRPGPGGGLRCATNKLYRDYDALDSIKEIQL